MSLLEASPPPLSPTLVLSRGAVAGAAASLPEVPVSVERRRLAKRLWRALAADGTEIGFEGDRPVRHGDVVHATAAARYVVRQPAEPVLEIPLDMEPNAAALVGWSVGNLHFPIEAQGPRLLVQDDAGLRATLGRMGITFRALTAVFQPLRQAAGQGAHSHGPGGE